MGTLEDIGNAISNGLTSSLRRLTATLFIIFATGVVYGSLIAQHNPPMLPFAVAVPLVLAVVAYFSTAFAVIVFVLLAIILLLF